MSGKTLIDGDPLCYRAAFSAKDEPLEVAEDKLEGFVREILMETQMFWSEDDYEVYLTGKGNFRYDIAKSYPYKGNRDGVEKPLHLEALKDYLTENWGAITSVNEEADDLISIRATELGSNTIIASVDKDFQQVPAVHYNPTKSEYKVMSEWQGLQFFYKQILTGDRVDNIIGLHGIGPVKSDKMIEGASTEEELYQICIDAYDGDVDRVIENARLLWLRRYAHQLWEPPVLEDN